MRLRSVDAHESRRLASFAVYAAGPVAVVAVWWLHGKGLIASTPMWVLAAIILGTGVANLATSIWLDRRPQSTLRLQVRIALSVLCTATVIYAAGWGSVLLIAYALGSAELLRTVGGRTVRPNMVWNWVAILAGEIAVAVGIAPTMIDPGLGHTIALVGGLCLMIVTDVLGRAAQATEAAQAQVRERGARFEALVERAADIIGVISTDGSVVSVSGQDWPAGVWVRVTLGGVYACEILSKGTGALGPQNCTVPTIAAGTYDLRATVGAIEVVVPDEVEALTTLLSGAMNEAALSLAEEGPSVRDAVHAGLDRLLTGLRR